MPRQHIANDWGEEEPGSHPSGSKTERDRRQAEKSQRRGRRRENKNTKKVKILRVNKALLNELESFCPQQCPSGDSRNGLGALLGRSRGAVGRQVAEHFNRHIYVFQRPSGSKTEERQKTRREEAERKHKHI